MGKLFRAAVLFAAIGAVMSVGSLATVAPAQVTDKKDTDKKDKKATAADDKEIGVTEVYKAKDGWRYRVKNAEGKSIAIGVIGYETKEEVLKIVDLVKTTLTKSKVNVLKEAK